VPALLLAFLALDGLQKLVRIRSRVVVHVSKVPKLGINSV
jgi:hypothetical protein